MKTWNSIRPITYFILGGLCFISPLLVKEIGFFNNNIAWKIIFSLLFAGVAYVIHGFDIALDDETETD